MKPHTESIVNAVSSQIPFNAGPIVGVHIRRGDKLEKEAKYHKIEEYMAWSDIYFQIQDRILKRNVTRRVYVASDDPTVLPDVRYPNYEVYGNVHFAEAAKKRYTERSLRGLLSDVMMLSRCNYLVCTFSSHLCRLAYELMQVRHGDAGESFHSLDDSYYFGGQLQNDYIAIESHTAQDDTEINLRIGDLISHKKNHHDGYAMGFNKRTGKRGKFPRFKVEEQWRIVD
ncbi:variant SH3 domain protein [Cooperia oncophora]